MNRLNNTENRDRLTIDRAVGGGSLGSRGIEQKGERTHGHEITSLITVTVPFIAVKR